MVLSGVARLLVILARGHECLLVDLMRADDGAEVHDQREQVEEVYCPLKQQSHDEVESLRQADDEVGSSGPRGGACCLQKHAATNPC